MGPSRVAAPVAGAALPDSGRVEISGVPPSGEILNRTGYLPATSWLD